MRRGIAGAVLGLMLLSGPAEAHTKKYKTTISVFATQVAATGSVQAGNPGPIECREGRTVTVEQAGVQKGQDDTDANGMYYVAASYTLGVPVTASVEKFVIKKSRRHQHLCTAASNAYSPQT